MSSIRLVMRSRSNSRLEVEWHVCPAGPGPVTVPLITGTMELDIDIWVLEDVL